MDDSSITDEERTMELEALLSIYEGELRVCLAEDQHSTISYEIDLKDIEAVLTLTLSDNYPKSAPTIRVQRCGKPLDDLEGFLKTVSDNLCGEVMIHSLIEEAKKWARESGYYRGLQEVNLGKGLTSSSICKFFLEGRCRFGDKCLNIHQLIDKQVKNDPNSLINRDTSEGKVEARTDKMAKKSTNSTHSKEAKTATKKAAMKTATDVISRILWDDKIDPKDFTIGYLDRFLGVIEREFADFSWDDIASVDYDVLSIPKHRIQYFKYRGEIVWDKRERIDNIFGSTGSGVTILDVVGSERSQEERKMKYEVKEDKGDIEECDLDLLSCENERSISGKKGPNYFIAFKVQDTGILDKVDKLHKELIAREKSMIDGVISSQKMHVTLLVLTIKNDEELNCVKDVLRGTHHILPSTLPASTKLTFKDVGSLRDRILYVSVEKDPNLEKFVKILKQNFHKAGINLNGNRDVFMPHMTVWRSPSSLKVSQATTKELFSSFESTYKNVEFGTQSIKEVELFSRFEAKDQNGFHQKVLTIKNSLLSVLPTLQGKVMKYVEDLYDTEEIGIEVKQKINGQCPEEALTQLEIAASRNSVQKNPRKLVVILRGIPGSGKTYLVENSLENTKLQEMTLCSPKQLFYRAGNSKIDQSELNIAEAYCRNAFLEALVGEAPLIVVDDCHSQTWQYSFYQKLARVFGVPVSVLEIKANDHDTVLECLKHGKSEATKDEILEVIRDWEEDPGAFRIEPWFRNPTLQVKEGIVLRDLLQSTK